VACGVAVGTAVLTGALLVGDSMRGSLRDLTLDRLGQIDEVLLVPRYFRAALADELAAEPQFPRPASATAAILLDVNFQTAAGDVGRANRVKLIACDPQRFWALGSGRPAHLPGRGEVVLNEPLAERLHAAVGDAVLLRLPLPGTIPADSPLGRKQETVGTQRLRVAAIVAAVGLGRFGLSANQQLPLNAYVPLDWLQERLNQSGRANAILVAGVPSDIANPASGTGEASGTREAGGTRPASNIEALLHPKLADYGIRLRWVGRTGGTGAASGTRAEGYFDFSSERMLLEPAAEQAVLAALDRNDIQPVFTYLANTIADQGVTDDTGGASGTRPATGSTGGTRPSTVHRPPSTIPYSIITAVDFTKRPPLGPFVAPTGKPIAPLDDRQIVLNAWAAENLGARPGDTIRVDYFEPESSHGQVREASIALKLAAIAELSGAADDPAFTPDVPGVTDQRAMSDWNPPFPFDARRIRPADERYWVRYRGTPKAFVALSTGRRLWGSRFGRTTSIRIAGQPGMTVASLEQKLAIRSEAMGLVFQPVKQQSLAAAVGTTPFEVLFLMFSGFLIAAATMLQALLFRLGIDLRGPQIGLLLALGWRRRAVTRLLAREGLLVAAAGSLLGLLVGIGYGALLLAGLRTWWLGAIVTPFLRLHLTGTSLAIGYATGLLVAWLVIWRSVARAACLAPRQLLAGEVVGEAAGGRRQTAGRGKAGPARSRSRTTVLLWIDLAWLLLVAAAVVGLSWARLGEEEAAGAFFGAGAIALLAGLVMARAHFRAGMVGQAVALGRGNLLRLALRNAARNPGRSTLTIGLVATATFLIVAVSAFHVDVGGQSSDHQSGSGGFALVGESDQPIYQDLNGAEGRAALGFSAEDEKRLAKDQVQVIALREKAGDDASCLNLYQARRPTVLGVPQALIARGGFAWGASAAKSPAARENPWRLLDEPLPPDADGVTPVPVVLEQNTAMYALHLWNGVGESYAMPDGHGGSVRLRVVGLLDNSIFQGTLLLGEAAFLRLFPDAGGYQLFLVAAPAGAAGSVRKVLERSLGEYGFAAETTAQRLAGFMVVQNTYLSTFQSLGGLGLLLGTLGLAAVQLRNVLERRRQLALLRAIGFRRASLAGMVMSENALLLLLGLAIGVLAALVAVLPHVLSGRAAIPWGSLAATLGLVLAVGLTAGLAAVRAAVTAPLLRTLTAE
jgi:ABC-type lipoprotein release transport system permease subunit